MKANEAAELIEIMANSLRQNPAQFTFDINVTGSVHRSQGGGIGTYVQASGGGPGSTTIGFQSIASSGNIEITRKAADARMAERVAPLIEQLHLIAAELRSSEPDRGNLDKIVHSFVGTWVPQLVISVVSALITNSFA